MRFNAVQHQINLRIKFYPTNPFFGTLKGIRKPAKLLFSFTK